MKIVGFYGPDGFKLEEHPDPVPSSGQILLKVSACGICGGDIGVVHNKDAFPVPSDGIILGHEIVGEVVEDTSGSILQGTMLAIAPNIGCGTCWFCRHDLLNLCINMKPNTYLSGGGYADHYIVDRVQCHPIPKSASAIEYSMSEPLACCVHSLERVSMKLGNRVLIIGAGANAQLFVQLCRIQGASHITVMDTKPDRLDIALKLGADEIRCAEPNGPIENSSLGEDFDIVIVTRSKPGYFEAALSYCSWRGKILVYGVMKPGSKSALEPNLLWKKQLSIIGSRSYEAGNFQTALTLLSSGKVSVADLITRTISLDQVSVAFIDNQAHLKTVIVP